MTLSTQPRRPQPLRPEPPLHSLQTLLQLTVVALFTVTFIVQPARIPSESMLPTLRVGDFLLLDKQSFAPSGHGLFAHLTGKLMPRRGVQRGDLIVFRYPIDPAVAVVKRVVGVGGDRIRLHHGRVFVNGKAAAEPYAMFSATPPDPFRDEFPAQHRLSPDVEPGWWITLRREVHGGELTVPADQCFVLGDNRNNSLDSRYWGFVPDAAIEGRPLAVLLSAINPQPGASFGHRLEDVLSSERVVR